MDFRTLLGLLVLTLTLGLLAPAAARDLERETASLLYEPDEVVTAMRTPEPALESPAIMTVLTREQIRALGVRTLPELLEFVPGFVPQRSVAGDWWPGPRGLLDSNRNFMVMVDGLSINNQFLSSPYWTYDLLDLSRFSRIEIMRGPGSALYGATAFLAVINCLTDPHPAVDGTLRTTIGTFNTRGIGLDRVFQAGRTRFDLRLSGSSSDGQSRFVPRDLYGNAGLTHDGFTKRDLLLKVSDPRGWTFLAHHVEGHREGYLGYSDNLNDQTFFRRSNDLFSLRYQRNLADGGELSATVFHNRFSDSEEAQIFPPGYTDPAGVLFPSGARGLSLSRDAATSVSLHWQAPRSRRHRWSAGAEVTAIDLAESAVHASLAFPTDPSRLAFLPGAYPPPERASNRSFTLQDDIDLGQTTRLVIGARQDHHSQYGHAFSPRVGLIHRWSARWTGKLLYGCAFRNPSFFERNSNPTLAPEHINTWETQLVGELANGWLTKVNLFSNRLTDRIESTVTTEACVNVDQTRFDGLELEVRKRFRASQELFANVSTVRRRQITRPEAIFPLLPHNKLNFGYSCRVAGFDTTIWGNFTSKWNRNVADPRPPLPGFRQIHLTVQKTGFPGLGDRVLLRVRNLLNRSFAYPPGVPGTLSLDDYPQPGREMSLEFSWDL
ncbi:MAG: TonB-dependent receptor [Candidatus Ozemobacter sibiricus]|jgi:iron complex outermembrane receptor protein|uniref:TonB-dependent receptor n=1 Tax=Candidatus Ozemobacter sibiricus TaxID=2268124 RepID=A0A367ZT24_9BACT|nr:MAG: TonB-dependent receptor [Candidatus Ozemobacter sibiricus]